MVGPGLLIAVAVLVAVLTHEARSTRVLDRDVAWLAGGTIRRPVPDDEASVVARYLGRHRRARVAGGLLGVAFAVVVGIRFYGTVGIGVGVRSPLADMLFCGIAGVVLGALAAEVWRIPRPAGAVAEASLAPRARAPHRRMVTVARTTAAVVAALGLAIALAGRGSGPFVAAVLGVGVVGVAALARCRIVGRARPAMSARAARLDQRLREFALVSLAYLEASAAVLAAAWLGSALPTTDAWPVLAFGVGTGGLLLAIALLRRAAPRPPRRWQLP